MQKWVKNEEEAQKFDMIKKNSWLRVEEMSRSIILRRFDHECSGRSLEVVSFARSAGLDT